MIKVESCKKNRAEFWTFFAFPNFRGPAFRKLYQCLLDRSCPMDLHYKIHADSDQVAKFQGDRSRQSLASRHVVWKMFCRNTPTSPEVIVANTLNFKPNFKFSRLIFFLGGTLIPIWVFAIKTWSISSAYKTLKGRTR